MRYKDESSVHPLPPPLELFSCLVTNFKIILGSQNDLNELVANETGTVNVSVSLSKRRAQRRSSSTAAVGGSAQARTGSAPPPLGSTDGSSSGAGGGGGEGGRREGAGTVDRPSSDESVRCASSLVDAEEQSAGDTNDF